MALFLSRNKWPPRYYHLRSLTFIVRMSRGIIIFFNVSGFCSYLSCCVINFICQFSTQSAYMSWATLTRIVSTSQKNYNLNLFAEHSSIYNFLMFRNQLVKLSVDVLHVMNKLSRIFKLNGVWSNVLQKFAIKRLSCTMAYKCC